MSIKKSRPNSFSGLKLALISLSVIASGAFALNAVRVTDAYARSRTEVSRSGGVDAELGTAGGATVKRVEVKQVKVPEKYAAMIMEEAAKYNIDPRLVAGIIQKESRWDPNAHSYRDSKGLMQLFPGTDDDRAKDLGIYPDYDVWDPGTNIALGVAQINWLMEREYIGTDLKNILVAYNWGPGNFRKKLFEKGISVDEAILLDILPDETLKYLRDILVEKEVKIPEAITLSN